MNKLLSSKLRSAYPYSIVVLTGENARTLRSFSERDIG